MLYVKDFYTTRMMEQAECLCRAWLGWPLSGNRGYGFCNGMEIRFPNGEEKTRSGLGKYRMLAYGNVVSEKKIYCRNEADTF